MSFFRQIELIFLFELIKLSESDEKSFEELQKQSNISINWSKLYQLAYQHNVVCFIFPKLLRLKSVIPNHIFDDFYKYNLEVSIKNLIIEEEFKRIKKKLNDNGIEFIPMKGINLILKNIYPKRNQRKLGDIDLLIDENDASKIIKILGDSNYNLEPKDERLIKKVGIEKYKKLQIGALLNKSINQNTNIELDLHWKLAFKFLNDSNIHNFKKNDANSDLLILTIHHGLRERWYKLSHLIDLKLYIEKYHEYIAWDELYSQMKVLNIDQIFLLGLFWAEKYLRLNIPAHFKHQMNRFPLLKFKSKIFEKIWLGNNKNIPKTLIAIYSGIFLRRKQFNFVSTIIGYYFRNEVLDHTKTFPRIVRIFDLFGAFINRVINRKWPEEDFLN